MHGITTRRILLFLAPLPPPILSLLSRYVPEPDSFDGSVGNPLRVLSKSSITVRLRAYMDPHSNVVGAASWVDAAAGIRRMQLENNLATIEPTTSNGLPQPLASSCNGSWVSNQDSVGHDIQHTLHTTQEQCCKLCAATPHCAVAVWNSPAGQVLI